MGTYLISFLQNIFVSGTFSFEILPYKNFIGNFFGKRIFYTFFYRTIFFKFFSMGNFPLKFCNKFFYTSFSQENFFKLFFQKQFSSKILSQKIFFDNFLWTFLFTKHFILDFFSLEIFFSLSPQKNWHFPVKHFTSKTRKNWR